MPRRGTTGAAALVLLLVSACGGAKHAASSPTQAVSDTWSRFFNSTTSVSARESLLEDGSAFHANLEAQSHGSPMTASVQHVAVVDPLHATVSFSLTVGKSKNLPSVAGAAVRSDGKWLVSKSTYCLVLSALGEHAQACG